MMQIRTAVLDDLKTLLAFEQGIMSTERAFDPTIKDTPTNYYDLADLITSPVAEVAVVEDNGEIIASGYALIKEAKPFLKHTRYVHLGFMFVKPAYRGNGVNKLVLEHLKAWAKSNSITEMRLEVYQENVNALKAYEKFGFSPLLLEMRIEIK